MSSLVEIPSHLLPAWVILRRKPEENAYYGLIENSFSMDWSADRVRVHWTGTAYSIVGEIKIDGKRDALSTAANQRKRHPEWTIEAYDLSDPSCPIEIDIPFWLEAVKAGQSRKFDARNAKFKMKDDY